MHFALARNEGWNNCIIFSLEWYVQAQPYTTPATTLLVQNRDTVGVLDGCSIRLEPLEIFVEINEAHVKKRKKEMSHQTAGNGDKPRYWLLTSPRTASTMLVRMLNLEAQGVRPSFHGGYFFLRASMKRMGLMRKHPSVWTEEEKGELRHLFEECFEKLQDHITASEKNDQLVFVKEHVTLSLNPAFEAQFNYGKEAVPGEPKMLNQRGNDNPTRSDHNLTYLPDEFLKSWRPTFLIRHPAAQFSSYVRSVYNNKQHQMVENNRPLASEITYTFVRELYTLYAEYYRGSNEWPIVLDSDDIIKDPTIVRKYAKAAGLDPDKVRLSWDTMNEEQLKAMGEGEKAMHATLHNSTGVDKSKLAGDVDIDAEAVKWKAEFGDDVGQQLEKAVRDAMPDYNYLWERRMTLD